jgi:pyruvate formate lyase activating enzyme
MVSYPLGVCAECIYSDFDRVYRHIKSVHIKTRKDFELLESPPSDPAGIRCNLCINECRIPEGARGFCWIRENKQGRLKGGYEEDGNLLWYHDPLPTNCVGDWVCPGGTGAGYPRFSHTKGAEFGYKNLAVFYNSCTFNCLFCQNWHFRTESRRQASLSAKELAGFVDERTSCVCFFGGDPASQLLHALSSAEAMLEKKRGRIFRVCWETNGSMQKGFLKKMIELSLGSGGCIKFDLKAYSKEMSLTLCGIENRQTLSNFEELSDYIKERPDPPLLIASTLLVPGYIDKDEVEKIAKFIARLDPTIPYSLLAFYPQFYMSDLPTTSRSHAERCLKVAKNAGLLRVKIGNLHLLSDGYE